MSAMIQGNPQAVIAAAKAERERRMSSRARDTDIEDAAASGTTTKRSDYESKAITQEQRTTPAPSSIWEQLLRDLTCKALTQRVLRQQPRR